MKVRILELGSLKTPCKPEKEKGNRGDPLASWECVKLGTIGSAFCSSKKAPFLRRPGGGGGKRPRGQVKKKKNTRKAQRTRRKNKGNNIPHSRWGVAIQYQAGEEKGGGGESNKNFRRGRVSDKWT